MVDELQRGREAYAGRAWAGAHEALSLADQAARLKPEDLELLATSAYMIGLDDEWMDLLTRAHHAYLDSGEPLRAVRCAFWVGVNLALRGEIGGATGWLGRAHRLLEGQERECVEQGYLLLPVMFQHEAAGDYDAAAATAGAAAQAGQRFGDQDLFALSVHGQGHMLIKAGRVNEGLGLLDEAMVAVTSAELSPIVTGLVYCGVIAGCQDVYEVRRAKDWTAALTRWCEQQPEMVAFTGRCLVHRAEILQLQGSWPAALAEARRAGQRLATTINQAAEAQAYYREGELHRLQGEFGAAEDAFRESSRCGWEPQPGLALLRLAQGRRDSAATAIRRALGETTDCLRRASLLPAYVEITLAAGDLEAARAGSRELQEIAGSYGSAMLDAMAAQSRGAVELPEGDAHAALPALRHASQRWRELDAPYEAACARVLVGLACRALGDEDSASLELEGARGVFEELGAAPDLVRVDSLLRGAEPGNTHGLTRRELEVLRLVAAGKSNREVASTLVISEHTVARHLQNTFAKLGVSSRTAASAFAFEHGLV